MTNAHYLALVSTLRVFLRACQDAHACPVSGFNPLGYGHFGIEEVE